MPAAHQKRAGRASHLHWPVQCLSLNTGAPMTTDDPWRNARTRNAGKSSSPPKHAVEPKRPAPPRRVAVETPVTEERAPDPRREQRDRELRIFGINACLSVYRHRPQAIRKIYLTEAKLDRFRSVLTWCAGERIGYRLVETNDLDKLTQSQHHEGVCFEVIPPAALTLDDLIARIGKTERGWLVWLDGVGNPHNLGAILRSAAHFGCVGLILHRDALGLSGAACRVAEGAAEVVPIARVNDARGSMAKLKLYGYQGIATVVRGGDDVFAAKLPPKAVLVMGAESEGMSSSLIAACDQHLGIPGSGAVESLNVSAAFAVFAAALSRL
jgi:RNA methyltransferase, TrmH family